MIHKKGFFDFLFSLTVTFFAFISFLGLLIFLVIGFTIGIFDWGVDEILCMVFAVFLPANVISFLMMFLAGWRYWSFDQNAVYNGNLILKKKLLFSEVERYEIKNVCVSYNLKGFSAQTECILFYEGKHILKIPLWSLSIDELEYLKAKVKNKNKSHN